MADKSVIRIAENFLNYIPEEIDVKGAYLFGSHVRGTEGEESDIDIAVIIKNMSDFFDVQMKLMRTRRLVDLRIEPHPIDEKDFSDQDPFVHEIKQNGIEINNLIHNP